MNGVRLFMDVNVPMYAGGTEHQLREACVWVMRRTAEGLLDVVSDTEIFQEILHRYSAIGVPQTGITMATNLRDIIPTIFPVTVADVGVTIEIFEKYARQGVTARDAMHVAVMRNNGLTHIVSADQHFDCVQGITRVAIGSLEQTKLEIERLNR